jgi:alanine racemase
VVVNSWIEVSEERLAGNFRAIKEAAGAETEVLAVVKANAYGHGAEVCSVALARAGARWMGVTCASEGVRVRRALGEANFAHGEGTPRILVMCGFMRDEVAAITDHGLTPVVWTAEQVAALRGSGVAAHVEVDTGMGRLGIRPGGELDGLLDAMSEAGIALDGVFTHFGAADVAHSELTQVQERRFEAAVAQLRSRSQKGGLAPKWVHAGSSSTLDNPAQHSPWLVELAKSVGARAMVRSGIALYGYCLPIEDSQEHGGDAGSVRSKLRPSLRPVMQWKTRVMDVRDIAAGDTVGYNATFTARRPMRLAMLLVGYADGLRRELSGSDARPGGWVMVRGRRANILGRISMNLTMVDVSGIEGVRVGDEVVLLGDGVTADDHARLAETISYEILCGVRTMQL